METRYALEALIQDTRAEPFYAYQDEVVLTELTPLDRKLNPGYYRHADDMGDRVSIV